MRPAWGPSHLLFLAEAFADHLILGRFHEAGADPFSRPVALTVVGNEATVVLNVDVKLFHGFQQFACGSMATRGHGSIQIHLDGLHHFKAL
jgi:hypothetical protein